MILVFLLGLAALPLVGEATSTQDMVDAINATGLAVIGTPDDAIAYIETLLQGAGGFGALLQLAHNWADWAETKRHYELMARYVFPHFQDSNRLRALSYEHSHANRDVFAGAGAAAVQHEIDAYRARKKGD